jgi:hypothetical protein
VAFPFALLTAWLITLKWATEGCADLGHLQTSLRGEFPLPRAGRILFSTGKSRRSQHYPLRRENRCGG